MSFEIEKATLGVFLKFKNGKTSPERADDASFPVFGSNGLIGRAESTNCPEKTIIIGRVGSYCGSIHFSKERCWVSDNAISCSSKNAGEEHFWFYVLTKLNLNQFSSGSGQPLLNQATLNAVECQVPSSPSFRALIGGVLNDFDKKIKLNTQTNQTLEEMAQAIFKSWFVDFDPVKAKMNGEQPEGMDAATASLFPEKLVESELGLIPEGWDILPLSSYINIKHGFAFKGEYFSVQETGDICVTPGNFRIGGGIKLDKLKYYDGPIPDDYVLTKGDLMVTMTDLSKQADTLGYPAFVPESEGKTYLHNQRIGKVDLKIEQDIKNYLYSFFCSSGYRNEVLSGVTGSTVKHTAPKHIMAIEVALDLRVADKFSQLVVPLFEKKAQNLVENSYLEKLRDTLLPKLLSGEIELAETTI